MIKLSRGLSILIYSDIDHLTMPIIIHQFVSNIQVLITPSNSYFLSSKPTIIYLIHRNQCSIMMLDFSAIYNSSDMLRNYNRTDVITGNPYNPRGGKRQ